MSNTQGNVADTGQGFIVGVEPAQPRMANEFIPQRPDQAVSQPTQSRNGPPPEERPAYRWTDEDVENARKQEKEKLYPRIEEMNEQLKAIYARNARPRRPNVSGSPQRQQKLSVPRRKGN